MKCVTLSASKALTVIGLITPVNTGTVNEPILELDVLGRITEKASCELPDNKECLFSYKAAETPEIT